MADALLIAVTGPAHGVPWAWMATRWHLRRHGVRPVYVTAQRPIDWNAVHGVIIGGGNDIDPAIYGGDVSESRSIDPQRDELEMAAIDAADRRDLPVLGICRGAQLLNVQRGGSLVSDLKPIRHHTSNRGTLLPRKHVTVDQSSTLHGWLGRASLRVNSLHHQAVDRVGSELRVVARDRDDIVQGIESTSGPVRVGVQWHPEYMPQIASQRRLFGAFAELCRAQRAKMPLPHAL